MLKVPSSLKPIVHDGTAARRETPRAIAKRARLAGLTVWTPSEQRNSSGIDFL